MVWLIDMVAQVIGSPALPARWQKEPMVVGVRTAIIGDVDEPLRIISPAPIPESHNADMAVRIVVVSAMRQIRAANLDSSGDVT